MKLLIITQKLNVNDTILGFFHQWVLEFAKHTEKITVLCLEEGEHYLPHNVTVLSLGKEKKISRVRYLYNFYRYIWKERKRYDTVFVHMNPVYVLLGGVLWHLLGKHIILWYTHRSADMKLKIAEKLVHVIFTAAKDDFILSSGKVVESGHGIDMEKFTYREKGIGVYGKKHRLRILQPGRIASIKNIELLIRAAAIVQKSGTNFMITIAGMPITTADSHYLKKLKHLIEELRLEDSIRFAGPISYRQIEEYYHANDIVVNLSDTGSIDKVVLEAVSCGLHIVTSNLAFKEIFPQYYVEKEENDIAKKIIELSSMPVDKSTRKYVLENHNLSTLIDSMITR